MDGSFVENNQTIKLCFNILVFEHILHQEYYTRVIIALSLMATNNIMDIIILSHPQDNVNRQIYSSIARKITCRVTDETANVAYLQTDTE